MSLLYEDNFISKNTLLQSQTFMHLFEDTQIINARNLILPATKLINNCYSSMFSGCTSLTLAPAELPATTLANNCYVNMFSGCTSLSTAPELPATTLANNCYVNMFSGCTSLSTAPELPATTLANNCYDHMFGGCTSLTTAPELPATKLVYGCYSNMFNGCTNLNYIKAMFTTTPSTTYTQNWVKGVASTGTFVKNSAATWDVTGIHGIPTGWTVEYPAILYFDDFPNNDDDNIWDEYDDIVARSIEDPEGMQCNKMKYMGQTIEIDG
ncbi:leucine-rich repeat protein [bacterium]|nr:leucine-rich repeat protein [bacterium]